MAGWRTLVVTSEARLVVRNGNLHLERDDHQLTLPIEDIDAVIIESPRGNVTISVLSELAQRGVALLVVDGKHTPCGVLLPYSQNPHVPSLLKAQIELTEPFKKRVWQRIVQQKILNAAACLDVLGRQGSEKLREIAASVRSGDSTAREAYAARTYFKLLEPGFRRRSDSALSSALDYGYAIVRGAVARSLASAGLQCALGVGHRSSANPFNLADDFVEVFRPCVDLMVFRQPPEAKGPLSTDYRSYLVSILRLECSIHGSTYTVSTASQEIAESYARAILARDYRALALPELVGNQVRHYE
jgi:CRISPR-associated protein Cas1